MDTFEAVKALPSIGPTSVTRYRDAELTLQRLRYDGSGPVMAGGFPAQDRFVAVLQVSPLPAHSYWIDGKHHAHDGGPSASINIFDIQAGPVCIIEGPVDNLHFSIPRAALDNLSDETDAPRIDRLYTGDGWDTHDTVIGGLKQSLVAMLEQPQTASQLFVDHTLLALHGYLASIYGGLRVAQRRHTGGLAPWQERAAKEIMAANFNKDIGLADIAEAVGLSVAHFSRAFKATTAMTPHSWLQSLRVERARSLLEASPLTLAEIALAAGFADQSHFTRIFSRATGTTPGAWRRCRLG